MEIMKNNQFMVIKNNNHSKKVKISIKTAEELAHMDFPDREWLIKDLWREREHMMIYSPTGMGKSWFAWSIATAITGGGVIKEGLWENEKPEKVLLIDGEMDMEDLKERQELSIKATYADQESVYKNLQIISGQDQMMNLGFLNLGNKESQKSLINYVENEGIRVVILDNFSTLVDMPDENSASCMQPFQDFLLNMKQREISTLLVHHSKKYPNGQSMAYRGSQKLSVTFDNILQLAPTESNDGNEDDGCSFHITSDKQRRGGEINCALRLNSVSGTWEIIEHIPKHLRELRDAIHLDQFKNQNELADHLGTDQSTVSRGMSNAIQLGILISERIKDAFKLAREKEVEFDKDDF